MPFSKSLQGIKPAITMRPVSKESTLLFWLEYKIDSVKLVKHCIASEWLHAVSFFSQKKVYF